MNISAIFTIALWESLTIFIQKTSVIQVKICFILIEGYFNPKTRYFDNNFALACISSFQVPEFRFFLRKKKHCIEYSISWGCTVMND